MILIALCLVVIMSGCNPCNPPKINLKCEYVGRRPQVMTFQEEYVIDYQDCIVEYYGPDEFSDNDSYIPLSPDMFQPDQDEEEKLSVGDIVTVNVLDDEETSATETVIAPDGCLYCSILEPTPASGKSVVDVKQELVAQLDYYLIDPQVALIPKEMSGRSFKIMGRVNLPGVYPIMGSMRLRDAIGTAGGIVSESNVSEDNSQKVLVVDLEKSFVVRDNKKLDIDFDKLINEPGVDQNIYVRPNDYIYLADSNKKEIFVLGAVEAPQRLPHFPGITLIGALSSVSGWPTPGPYSTDLKSILVIRGGLDCPQVVQIDLRKVLTGQARDFYLMPGDIVYAMNKKFRFGRELVRLALDAFVASFGVAAGDHFALRHLLKDRLDIDE